MAPRDSRAPEPRLPAASTQVPTEKGDWVHRMGPAQSPLGGLRDSRGQQGGQKRRPGPSERSENSSSWEENKFLNFPWKSETLAPPRAIKRPYLLARLKIKDPHPEALGVRGGLGVGLAGMELAVSLKAGVCPLWAVIPNSIRLDNFQSPVNGDMYTAAVVTEALSGKRGLPA